MINLFLVTILMSLLSNTSATAAEMRQGTRETRIAVFDIDTSYRFDKKLSDSIWNAMREEISRTGSYIVLERDWLNKMPGYQKCRIDSYSKDCFIKQGELLKTGRVITGNIVYYKNLYYFSFIMVNAKTGKVENIIEDISTEDSIIETAKKIAHSLISRRFFFLEPKPKPDWNSLKEVDDFLRDTLSQPGKDVWQKPEMVIDRLQIKPGDSIAEIGGGLGYFTGWLSRKTGEKGTVYVTDIQKAMLTRVEEKAQKEGLRNIKTALVKPEDPSLPNNSMDLIFLCDVYTLFPDRQKYAAKLGQLLRKQGKIAIIDYDQPPNLPYAPFSAINFGSRGGIPDVLLIIDHFFNVSVPAGVPTRFRVPRERVIEEMSGAGFKLDAEYDFLPYQYFLVFSKK